MLSRVFILHGNARPHVAVAYQALLRHILGPLHKALKRRRFSDDNEVQAAVENWFLNQPRSYFFTHGIHHFLDRWDPCFNPQSGFV
ncbi:hypothetical protein TNCV_2932051 [Trichonephila clavipes]|nr:hypothetical protein TNCV_2932051 [Trichonephila clavipes]